MHHYVASTYAHRHAVTIAVGKKGWRATTHTARRRRPRASESTALRFRATKCWVPLPVSG